LVALCGACQGETGEPFSPAPNLAPDSPAVKATVSAAEEASSSPEDPKFPPGAVPDIVEALREFLEMPRHASDGAGRAWLERDPDELDYVIAGTPARFNLVFEVGPAGIVEGGYIDFLVSPFWNWSTPQVELPDYPGFTTVTPSADDIELKVETADQNLLRMWVAGRPLRAGEQIRLVYGASPAGALTDTMAEKNSRFWFGVDGDGDGGRWFIEDSPGIDVRAGLPVMLHVSLPSVVRTGEKVRITLAVLDQLANAGYPFEGSVSLTADPPVLELPEQVVFTAEDFGRKTLEVAVREPGIVRLRAEADNGLVGQSDPLLVSDEAPRLFWADLHGHSKLSDGTGTVEDYYLYARDIAALDVVALTDHDHWGVLPLATHPEMWDEIKAETRRFHQPGRFVTILGWEWTNWIHGHRHVLYFEDEGEVYDSISPDYETPAQLWDALRGQPALTFAHHSAGGPVPTNWDYPPDPILEPVTEIVSVHGSSEALDAPIPIYSPRPGNFVRDILSRGYRLGMIGSGDGHDGHPGLTHLGASTGGLAAIYADDLTRESILEAMRARRVYATNGPRILLRTALDSHRMGALIPKPPSGSYSGNLFVQVFTSSPLERIDLIRSGQLVDSVAIEGLLEVTLQRPIENLTSGEYLYVRAVQEDSGAAWSSPIFIE
jgi:hypothetical protein